MEGVATPPEFDAELYLRLAGERELLAGDDHGLDTSPLTAAAHALAAIGAIPAGTARAVLADYHLARACREGRSEPRREAATPEPPEVIGQLRVVPCGRVIEQPWGQLTIEFIVLSDDVTSLHVRMRSAQRPGSSRGIRTSSAHSGRWIGAGNSGPGSVVFGAGYPGNLTLTDDHGIVTDAHFSGGGDDTEWTGEYETRTPLAADAAWIEMLGERIMLTDRVGTGARVRTESLTGLDPAHGYLRTLLASANDFRRDRAADVALAALIAAGALADDDPEVSAARAVLAWQSRGWGGPASPGPLPEPWRALRSPADDGPEGLVVVGVVTPAFGGLTVAVKALMSASDGFSIGVETAPGVALAVDGIDDPILAWWTFDDNGHRYLGQPSDWSWNGGRASGTVSFSAPLDPAAAMLTLTPTTPAARAVIEIPLDWAG